MIDWLVDNQAVVLDYFGKHVLLTLIPLMLGLVIAIPVGWVANHYRAFYGPLLTISGLFYTIPSLALFIVMPLILGSKILDPINVVAALTVYTVALLVRTVADGLGAVPEDVLQAATAMGYRPLRRLLLVELPVAVPVIGAGMRVAVVSNVSLVSVAAVIGVPQLGQLFTDGFNRSFYTPLLVGVVLCLVLAVALDGVVVALTRWLTPWQRAVRS